MYAFFEDMRDSDSDGDNTPTTPPRRQISDAELALQLHGQYNNLRYRPEMTRYTFGPGARVQRLRQAQMIDTRRAEMERMIEEVVARKMAEMKKRSANKKRKPKTKPKANPKPKTKPKTMPKANPKPKTKPKTMPKLKVVKPKSKSQNKAKPIDLFR